MAKKSGITQLSASDLRHAADLQDKISAMQAALAKILGGGGTAPIKGNKAAKTEKVARRKPNISPAGRRRIAAAQKARWARVKAEKAAGEKKAK